jgi:hypothetical protein
LSKEAFFVFGDSVALWHEKSSIDAFRSGKKRVESEEVFLFGMPALVGLLVGRFAPITTVKEDLFRSVFFGDVTLSHLDTFFILTTTDSAGAISKLGGNKAGIF